MTTNLDFMLAGELYDSRDPELVALRRRARNQTYAYNQSAPDEGRKRRAILEELIDNPSHDAYIEAPTRMDYGRNLHIGQRFYANYESIFLDVAPITIGDNVLFGPRVGVYTAGHPTDPTIRNEGLEYGKPITIGSNVWIGGDTTIGPGVTIGDNCVIGAGAVVIKDIPANSLAGGVPAKVIRAIDEDDKTYWGQQKAHYFAQIDKA